MPAANEGRLITLDNGNNNCMRENDVEIVANKPLRIAKRNLETIQKFKEWR